VLGIPSAIAGGSAFFGDGFVRFTDWIYTGEGKNWFDSLIDLTFNLMLPLGGLGIALFVAWRVNAITREEGFKLGSRMGRMYWGWVRLLRWLVPIAVILVLLNALGALSWLTG
jgi:NSS family neurotransmitter:Na+ symporter